MAKPPPKSRSKDDDEKPSKKPATSRAIMAKDDRLQRMVQKAPVAAAITHAQVPLPKVDAPALEGIAVTVPAVAPVTTEDVTARFLELCRAAAPRRARAEGEKVGAGDEVVLDTVGYVGTRLIPFSIREGAHLDAAPLPMLPALGEALVGLEVGKSAVVEITLPGNYPVESLRGQKARFLVDVLEAFEVTPPQPSDPAFLRKLARGDTLDEVMASVAAELRGEREELQILEAQDRVLDALAARVKVDLPDGLIDEEIKRRWGEQEGKVTARKNFTPEEQQDAQRGWLQDPATRFDVARRLKIGLGLKAIVEKEKLQITAQNIGPLLEPVAARVGVSVDEVKGALRKQQGPAAQQVVDAALYMLAVGHVLGKAQITFED
ncbi:MAG: peptidylprolyl isomerase [Myxococcota bacterium]